MNTPTLKSKIDELLEAAEKATPRPWYVSTSMASFSSIYSDYGNVTTIHHGQHFTGDTRPDAHYITLSANLAPQMARELKNMMDALEIISKFERRYTESESTGIKYYHESECEIALEALARAKKELGCG